MKLIPMTQFDYDQWAPRSLEAYIQDKMRANGLTRAEAEDIGKNDFIRILPHGFNTEGNFLLKLMDEGNTLCGHLWFCIRGARENRQAYLCDIIVEEPFRGRGYGKAAMKLLEAQVAKLGVSKIGLHVFGFNERAIHLYKSLGYSVTDLVMEKQLPHKCDPGASKK